MYIVARGHFRSRDKEVGHTIRLVICEKPYAACQPHCCTCYRSGVIVDQIFTLRELRFSTFCFRDLDRDPITSLYELTRIPWSLEMYHTIENELTTTSRLSKLSLDRQTDRQTNTTEIIIYHAASRVVKNLPRCCLLQNNYRRTVTLLREALSPTCLYPSPLSLRRKTNLLCE